MSDALARWSTGMRRGARLVGWAVLLFLYIPIATLVAYSFNSERSFAFPISGFSVDWYRALAGNDDLLDAVWNSVLVAGAVVPFTLCLGVPAAFVLARHRFPGSTLLDRFFLLPLMIPGLITGLSILLLVKRAGFELSLATVVIGHAVAWLPIVITQIYARLRRLDPRIEEASMDLGAGPLETFFRIVLPNISNAIIGSALLVFTLSFDEIAITFMLTGTEMTLPMYIWAMLRRGVTPEICAIATLTVLASTILVVGSLRLLDRDRGP